MPRESIPIMRPLIGEPEAEAARRVILSGWTTQGPEVAAFETEFAGAVGAPYACAVSSCTAALHLALLAVGVEPGDEVVTASHSYIATANAIRYCGARPVFIDIDPGTYNLDARRLEASITERTRAILCVHRMGMPCDLSAINAVAGRRGMLVIEDAACAIGSEILQDGSWERIGRPRGDIACFSFHPRKLISTGDGGMLTTSNEAWIQRIRRARQHGMSVPDTVRHGSSEVVFEEYREQGYNYRMTDIQAAVGRVQLQRLPEIVQRRRLLAARYGQLLADSGVRLPEEPEWARSNWQSFCVGLPNECEQRSVMQFLLDRGIATRRGIMCSHREPSYAAGQWRKGSPSLEHSERAQDHTILLPLFHQMTEEEQEMVAATLREAVEVKYVVHH